MACEDGCVLVEVMFPGEIRIPKDGAITVGDVNVTKWLTDALGRYPRIHGRLEVRFIAEPLRATFASSTMGGAYQEPAEVD